MGPRSHDLSGTEGGHPGLPVGRVYVVGAGERGAAGVKEVAQSSLLGGHGLAALH